MFGFSLAGNFLALLLSGPLVLDLPLVLPSGARRHIPTSRTAEEYSAEHHWVAASAIPMGEHGLGLEVFADEDSSGVKGLLRDQIPDASLGPGLSPIPGSSCTHSILVSDLFPGGLTFDAMLRDSTAILSGTIVSQEPGFFYGIPVLLMRLRIDNAILPASANQAEFVDVFYPHANFALHGYRICGIQPYEEIRPRVGDKALVFAAQLLPKQGIAALMLAPERIAIESADGRLSLPRALRLDRRLSGVESLSELENILRRSLTELGTRRPGRE